MWQGGEDSSGMPDFRADELRGPVRYAGIKLFADGSISGKTAAVRNPYKTAEGEKLDYPCGMMTLEEPVFLAALSYARRNGVQLSIHIMGDRSIDAVLDWLSDADPWLADVPSVRLEHASLLRPDQLERIDQMRLKPAFTTQIIFPFAEWRSYRASLSDADFNAAYPVKSIAQRLMPLLCRPTRRARPGQIRTASLYLSRPQSRAATPTTAFLGLMRQCL